MQRKKQLEGFREENKKKKKTQKGIMCFPLLTKEKIIDKHCFLMAHGKSLFAIFKIIRSTKYTEFTPSHDFFFKFPFYYKSTFQYNNCIPVK